MSGAQNKSRLAALALFAAALIWGASFVTMKDVTEKLPPSLILGIRFTVACAALSLLFWRHWKAVTLRDLRAGGIIGVFLFIAYTVQTYGLTHTTPGKNAFLTASYCVITPFLFWAFSKRKPDRYHLLSAVVCLAGILLISVDFSTESLGTVGIGDILTLICGFFYAAHMVAIPVTAGDKDPVLITILQFGTAAILSWMLFGVLSAFGAAPVSATGDDIGSLVLSLTYLSLMCTAAALLLQNFGQKYANPTSAAIILTFESVFGALFSILLGREEGFTVWRGLGFLLMFFAVIVSETKLSFLKRKRREDHFANADRHAMR